MKRDLSKVRQLIVISCVFLGIILASSAYAEFNSIDIQASPLLGQKMETIEAEWGKAEWVEGFSIHDRKTFSREEWDSFAYELYTRGDYLYYFKRNNNEVRYAITYSLDTSESRFHPTERVLRVHVTFDKLPTINELSMLIPEIAPFNNENIKVFIQSSPILDGTRLLYVANPSDSAGWVATGYKENADGYGFAIEIVLEENDPQPNELSKVKEVVIDVSSIEPVGTFEYRLYNSIKLSK